MAGSNTSGGTGSASAGTGGSGATAGAGTGGGGATAGAGNSGGNSAAGGPATLVSGDVMWLRGLPQGALVMSLSPGPGAVVVAGGDNSFNREPTLDSFDAMGAAGTEHKLTSPTTSAYFSSVETTGGSIAAMGVLPEGVGALIGGQSIPQGGAFVGSFDDSGTQWLKPIDLGNRMNPAVSLAARAQSVFVTGTDSGPIGYEGLPTDPSCPQGTRGNFALFLASGAAQWVKHFCGAVGSPGYVMLSAPVVHESGSVSTVADAPLATSDVPSGTSFITFDATGQVTNAVPLWPTTASKTFVDAAFPMGSDSTLFVVESSEPITIGPLAFTDTITRLGIVLLDAQGQFQSGTLLPTWTRAIAPTPNGGLVLAGYQMDSSVFTIAKLSLDGTELLHVELDASQASSPPTPGELGAWVSADDSGVIYFASGSKLRTLQDPPPTQLGDPQGSVFLGALKP